MSSEELKQTGDLLDGLVLNPPSPVSASPGGSSAPAANVDARGVAFDPAVHKTDASGAPLLGSKQQFLLKKEAKKSALKRVTDKISELWNGEKPEEPEVPEIRNLPPSDHEIDKIPSEKPEVEISEPPRGSAINAELTASSENSADLFFIGGSMALGIEFLNQRDRFHPKVAAEIYRYEQKTGKSIDLPPGIALALGLGRIGYEIIQREPACKQRFDKGVSVVRDNAAKYIRSKIPVLNKLQRPEEPDAAA